MLSELELKAYSLEWGNPSFATYISLRDYVSLTTSCSCGAFTGSVSLAV